MDPDKLTFSSQLSIFDVSDSRKDAQHPRYHCRFVRSGPIVAADGSPMNNIISLYALSLAVERGCFNQLAVFVDHAGLYEYPSLRTIFGYTKNALFTSDAVEGDIELYSTATGIESVDLVLQPSGLAISEIIQGFDPLTDLRDAFQPYAPN